MNLGRLCETCGQALHSTIHLDRRLVPTPAPIRLWQCPSLHQVWLVDASPIGTTLTPPAPPPPTAPPTAQGRLFG